MGVNWIGNAYDFLWNRFHCIQIFEFPQGICLISLNKAVTRCFDLCWDRTLHLWVYELKYKCLLKVIVLIHRMATPKISRSCYWALLITAKPFSCTQHIRYCLMVGILGGIMPFMIIPWILIDTLFDQKRYSGWIRVSRCQKLQDTPYKKCLFCLQTFPWTVICSLPLLSVSPHFFLLPDTFESHITFQTVHRKRSNIPSHSLFLLMWKPEGCL